jgi:hypothetical protein
LPSRPGGTSYRRAVSPFFPNDSNVLGNIGSEKVASGAVKLAKAARREMKA